MRYPFAGNKIGKSERGTQKTKPNWADNIFRCLFQYSSHFLLFSIKIFLKGTQ